MLRNRTFSDRIMGHLDNALKTLTPGAVKAKAPRPGHEETSDLSDDMSRHVAGLMRINHTGEVCAQALYQGQSLTAKLPDIREKMELAAEEELDHLAWCEARLNELNAHTSYLNPVFYGLSYGLGAAAGLAGDKWSLGFVAATEEQVSKHLADHLHEIQEQDPRSTLIIEQMLEDETRHANSALEAGGVNFPKTVKLFMTGVSQVMTKTTYRI
ncbi:2-polyprenyl-3-methyl-6-methoxy-1,4-benzoquinone monooxygenase [Reinekea forsetii]|nr:2-polyprenyl-3-methyl-6-methoxy-1,4-benzoquinone monooxygenase [Reinekea forsetii]